MSASAKELWLRVLRTMRQADQEGWFERPVVKAWPELLPVYHAVIREPCSFSDVENELGMLLHHGHGAVAAKIDRIFLNAWAYNSPGHAVGQAAMRLQKRLHAVLDLEGLPRPPLVRPSDVLKAQVDDRFPSHCQSIEYMPHGGAAGTTKKGSGRRKSAPKRNAVTGTPASKRARVAAKASAAEAETAVAESSAAALPPPPPPPPPPLGCEERLHFEEYERELRRLQRAADQREESFNARSRSAHLPRDPAWKADRAAFARVNAALEELVFKMGLFVDTDDALRQDMVDAPSNEEWIRLITKAITAQGSCVSLEEAARELAAPSGLGLAGVLVDCKLELQQLRTDANICMLFFSPVDPQADDVPDYPEVVDRPIDLSQVLNRISAGQYTTVEQMDVDVTQVTANVDLYWQGERSQQKHQIAVWVRETAARLLERWEAVLEAALGNHEHGEAGQLLRDDADQLMRRMAGIRAGREQERQRVLREERLAGVIAMSNVRRVELTHWFEGNVADDAVAAEATAAVSTDPNAKMTEDEEYDLDIGDLLPATQWKLWYVKDEAEKRPPAQRPAASSVPAARGSASPTSKVLSTAGDKASSAFRSPRLGPSDVGSRAAADFSEGGECGEGEDRGVAADTPVVGFGDTAQRAAMLPSPEAGQEKADDGGWGEDDDGGGWQEVGKVEGDSPAQGPGSGPATGSPPDAEIEQARMRLQRQEMRRSDGDAAQLEAERLRRREEALRERRQKEELAADRERQCVESGLHFEAEFQEAMNEWENDEEGRIDGCALFGADEPDRGGGGGPKMLAHVFDSCPTPKVTAMPPSIFRDGTSESRIRDPGRKGSKGSTQSKLTSPQKPTPWTEVPKDGRAESWAPNSPQLALRASAEGEDGLQGTAFAGNDNYTFA